MNSFFKRIKNSFYILSIKEWNLDSFLYRTLWNPFKWAGRKLDFLQAKVSVFLLITVFLLGLYSDRYPERIPVALYAYLPVFFSLLGLLLIIRSFSERADAIRAWVFIIVAQLFITLSIALFHENFGRNDMLIYLGGAVICSVTGYICLVKLKRIEKDASLNRFHGHAYEHPVLAFVFLLSCLGLVGFPFTPTFIGIDLLFSHIHKQETLLIVFIALSFIFMELAVIRIYARIFLGQHRKNYHPVAYRSS